MTTQQDQIYSDCLRAMKNEAVLLHPRGIQDEKQLYLKFPGGYKENVPLGIWKRLIKHPQVKKELKGKWEIYVYHFEGDMH